MRNKRKTGCFCRVILIIGLITLAEKPTVQAQQSQKIVLQEVKVKPGDTLWSIANYYLKDPRAWPEILKYNKLPSSDIYAILPGVELKIPVRLVKEHLRPAYLIYVLKQVRYRKRNTVKWKPAKLDMSLYNEDGVRTMTQSKAKVKFLTGEIVALDENSLVILRPEKKREEVQLFSGAVRASRSKIITDGATIDPKIDPRSPKADFKTRIKQDKTTLVEVYGGIVDVTAQGETVTLTKGFGTQVKYLEPPSVPRKLPPLPEFSQKSLGKPSATQPLTEQEPTISAKGNLTVNLQLPRFAKTETQAQTISKLLMQYHLQIAKDKEFSKIVVNETKELKDKVDLELNRRKLDDGKYYYRLSYVDELGFESKFTPTRTFIIDTVSPVIEIYRPRDSEQTKEEFIHVEGKTEPGLSLRINDKTVTAGNDGKFFTAIAARKGKNKIIILGKDNAENVTQLVRNVYRVKKVSKPDIKTQETRAKRKLKKPRWFQTPASIASTVLTFAVIIGVIIVIFSPK